MSDVFLVNLCSLCDTFMLKECFINAFYDEFCLWSDFQVFKIFRVFILDRQEYFDLIGCKIISCAIPTTIFFFWEGVLIGCKIISWAIPTTISFFFFLGGGRVKVQTEAIKRKNIDKNLHIFFYFSFRRTKLLLSFLPNTFERLSCPFSKQGIWCIKRYWL